MFLLSFLAIASANHPPPIVNGERTDAFIQVGALVAYHPDYGGSPFCSGTIVDKKWAITAAHCVEALDEYAAANFDILYVIGDNLYRESGIVQYEAIVSWARHPDYSASQLKHDIGVLEFENEFTDFDPIPIGLSSPEDDWTGVVLDYVGWGVTGDERNDSGYKRTASIPFYDYDTQFIYAIDLQGEVNLCSGDSGGAALKEMEDGGHELVGVNSFVFGYLSNQTACEGGGSGATRIDVNYTWVREYIPEPLPPEPESLPEAIEEEEEQVKESSGCSTIGFGDPSFILIGVLLLGWRLEKESRSSR